MVSIFPYCSYCAYYKCNKIQIIQTIAGNLVLDMLYLLQGSNDPDRWWSQCSSHDGYHSCLQGPINLRREQGASRQLWIQAMNWVIVTVQRASKRHPFGRNEQFLTLTALPLTTLHKPTWAEFHSDVSLYFRQLSLLAP